MANGRATMTLSATLKDGTSINLTVSPANGSTPQITAHTSFSDHSLSIEICSSHTNPIKSTHPTLDCKSITMVKSADVCVLGRFFTYLNDLTNHRQIPADVVAVESDSRGYLFYVDKKGQLAYLLGPKDGDDFTSVVVKDAVDKPVLINPAVNQIAAISWANPNGCGREVGTSWHLTILVTLLMDLALRFASTTPPKRVVSSARST